jgi:hypothetical protein
MCQSHAFESIVDPEKLRVKGLISLSLSLSLSPSKSYQ